MYPNVGENITYPALGLAGEAGEVADVVKKIFRDDNGKLTQEKRDRLIGEIGDVLWYCAMLAFEIGVPLEAIAENNALKLKSRLARGVIKGSGDNR